jgi:hypothetical protein
MSTPGPLTVTPPGTVTYAQENRGPAATAMARALLFGRRVFLQGSFAMTGPDQTNRDQTDRAPSKDTPDQAPSKQPSLKETAASVAGEQKVAGAERLSGIAGAVHAAADEVERQVPGAGEYIHDAASRIDAMASGLRERSLGDLAEGMRQLGSERPLALFGGAVLAGFALSRFLKSGQERSSAGT